MEVQTEIIDDPFGEQRRMENERRKEMKYKVGDKVRVREDLVAGNRYGGQTFVDNMEALRGEVVEIDSLRPKRYLIKEDRMWIWTDEMFEGLANNAGRDPIQPDHYRNSDKDLFDAWGESEQTEVKKDLKEAILGIEVTQFDGQKADLEELVNPKQLENVISDWMPEVLSQEWINDNNEMFLINDTSVNAVQDHKLRNLLVPKREEVDQAYKDGYEKGKQHATEKQSEEAETVASVMADYLIASAKLKLALKMEVEELEE